MSEITKQDYLNGYKYYRKSCLESNEQPLNFTLWKSKMHDQVIRDLKRMKLID